MTVEFNFFIKKYKRKFWVGLRNEIGRRGLNFFQNKKKKKKKKVDPFFSLTHSLKLNQKN
jgi:hypothetical protein